MTPQFRVTVLVVREGKLLGENIMEANFPLPTPDVGDTITLRDSLRQKEITGVVTNRRFHYFKDTMVIDVVAEVT